VKQRGEILFCFTALEVVSAHATHILIPTVLEEHIIGASRTVLSLRY
jgi:hypothetical protein